MQRQKSQVPHNSTSTSFLLLAFLENCTLIRARQSQRLLYKSYLRKQQRHLLKSREFNDLLMLVVENGYQMDPQEFMSIWTN